MEAPPGAPLTAPPAPGGSCITPRHEGRRTRCKRSERTGRKRAPVWDSMKHDDAAVANARAGRLPRRSARGAARRPRARARARRGARAARRARRRGSPARVARAAHRVAPRGAAPSARGAQASASFAGGASSPTRAAMASACARVSSPRRVAARARARNAPRVPSSRERSSTPTSTRRSSAGVKGAMSGNMGRCECSGKGRRFLPPAPRRGKVHGRDDHACSLGGAPVAPYPEPRARTLSRTDAPNRSTRPPREERDAHDRHARHESVGPRHTRAHR
jgi:hypothetical protein